jgi:N-acetylglutamate synthase-like GNAT family acetyltransferase
MFINHITRMLRSDNRYRLIIALQDRRIIGVSLLYVFEYLKMALLDYITVIPKFQRQGIGRKLFELLMMRLII